MSTSIYSFERPDLTVAKKIYDQIRVCVAGELAVKAGGTRWLPQPNPSDTSKANTARYDAYVQRAVFYNVTGRTLSGMVGLLYYTDPVVTVPQGLVPLTENADGTGVDLIQMSKALTNNVLGYGRAGLLVDFPTTDQVATVDQINSGAIRPTITQYAPWNVINWRTMTIGSDQILSLVVLVESYDIADNEFETRQGKQFRVLELVDEGDGLFYRMKLIKETADGGRVQTKNAEGAIVDDEPQIFIPTDSNGQRLTRIPFSFVGAMNNDTCIDEPPMYAISSLNIAHYRNSADYEESSFVVGQPTPVFTGLTQEWVDDVLKGVVHIGSRASIPLPVGATADLLQAAPNMVPKEAMDSKEKQMRALGAKLISPASVERTATDALLEDASQVSILICTASNVQAAIVWALGIAADFAGTTQANINFVLDTDFQARVQTADQRRQLMEEWQAHAITFSEMRDNLSKIGVAVLDVEEARRIIELEKPKEPEVEVADPAAAE